MSLKKGNGMGFIKRAKYLAETVLSDDMIEIRSNSYALISGCRKLTEYSKERIALSFRKMNVVITGEDLEPESLINGQMALKGLIREVIYLDN